MRIFIKFDQNNLVVAQMESARVPGSTGTLPADILEVTGRNDGPWIGKIWNPGTGSFTDKAPSKIDLRTVADSKFQEWNQARVTLAGAQSHGEAAQVINFLTTQEANSWNAYKQAIQAWIQAP